MGAVVTGDPTLTVDWRGIVTRTMRSGVAVRVGYVDRDGSYWRAVLEGGRTVGRYRTRREALDALDGAA
jgi:hypothetical protein